MNQNLSKHGAHSYVESSIDATLYQKITGKSVTKFAFYPAYSLSQPQKNAIAWCYHNILHDLYSRDIPISKLEDTFADMVLG